ncbi:F-box/kelch-repeat protein At3g23880-like [Lotus japonicus]|uniref:F-box/kelch-repeat protein At3g23880-like n=1 Tax=Lotus japonicus TaxID=34305 RepID=UPI002587C3BC|nr:F-box/kelch-repeat protein At3g23880-like [Lotus japonicus]XP_057427350.1 F-box/kelch-repeat protein At3g23880-like [Lotus japonicus]XP_057427351.1 F-box/kelch-repeat protein At3g23880-like [Lotus japonicus]
MKTEAQHLPQDLITEILLRLPVKSLIRFKAVCKFWRSLISDPLFANSHFELATPRLVFTTDSDYDIQTIDLDGRLHSNPFFEPINLDFLHSFFTFIEGSCRGFLLLRYYESLHLWNPATRVHRPIPSISAIEDPGCQFGFGYDSSKDDYLVVIVSNHVTPVQFFSLRANVWKYIQSTDLPPLNLCYNHRPGLLLNEAIHWLACGHDKTKNVIVAFDLLERRLLEIPLPDDLACNLKSCALLAHGGLLSVYVKRSDTLEIFVMEKYKIQSSWTKTIVVSLSGTDIFSICSTKSGDIVMHSMTGLEKYTDKGEQLLEHCVGGGLLISQVYMYTESILSLPDAKGQS